MSYTKTTTPRKSLIDAVRQDMMFPVEFVRERDIFAARYFAMDMSTEISGTRVVHASRLEPRRDFRVIEMDFTGVLNRFAVDVESLITIERPF